MGLRINTIFGFQGAFIRVDRKHYREIKMIGIYFMKVIIFGASKAGIELYVYINTSEANLDRVIAFTDNNTSLWNKYIEGVKVISPEKLATTEFDCIVLSGRFQFEMKRQLDEMGYSGLIYTAIEYQRKTYANRIYQKRYGRNVIKNTVFGEKIAIYTSITGNYDSLNEPLFISENVDYICFTNNNKLRSDIWNIEYICDSKLDNMHLAKKVKVFPEEYLKGYETSVWIDGKFQVTGDVKRYINKYEKTAPMLCFPHFQRACIYDEAAECILQGIGKKEDILRQITDYYASGYPLNNGLYEMGCIVRKHNNNQVRKLMSEWWKQICKYSYRDQISFPYICWNNNFIPDICDLDLYGKENWFLCTRGYSKAKQVRQQ